MSTALFLSVCLLTLVMIYLAFRINQKMKLADNNIEADTLNSISNVLLITDNNFQILEVNKATVDLLGLERSSIIGKEIFSLVRKLKIDPWKSLVESILSVKHYKNLKVQIKLNALEKNPMLNLTVSPLLNKNKEQIGHIFSGERISELAEKDIFIEQILDTKTIDFQKMKTPLTNLMSSLDLVERKIVKYQDFELKELVYQARQGASRIQHQIQDHLEANKEVSSKSIHTVDLNDTLFNICLKMQPALRKKRGEVLMSRMPIMNADEEHMTQLFSSLIENGFKHNKKRRPVVHVNHRHDNGQHLFAISDNGMGLDQKYYDQIFKMFKQIHTNPNFDDSSYGLSACKKIVDRYQGEIWLESNKDEGTTFFFTLTDN